MAHNRVRSISEGAWSRRHTVVVLSAAGLLILAATVGILSGEATDLTGSRVLVVALFLVLAAATRITEAQRSLLGSAGALVGASALIGASGGHPVAHLGFPFALVLVTLYRKVTPCILGVGFLSVYYGGIALVAPDLVFDLELLSVSPTLYSLGLVSLSLATTALGIASWVLDTGAAKEVTALSTALADAALRQRQATELHDTVIQGLALARYALDAGETELAREGVDSALANAKFLVGGLLTIEGADLSSLVTREFPAVIDDDTVASEDNDSTTVNSKILNQVAKDGKEGNEYD